MHGLASINSGPWTVGFPDYQIIEKSVSGLVKDLLKSNQALHCNNESLRDCSREASRAVIM